MRRRKAFQTREERRLVGFWGWVWNSKKGWHAKLYIGVIVTMLLLAGCGTGKEGSSSGTGQEGTVRTELTEEEMSQGHASFQMEENLVVDADVTAKEKYEKGFASYYMEIYYDADEGEEDSFKKNPTVSGHDLAGWEEQMNRIQPGKFKGKKFILDEGRVSASQEYIADNGKEYFLNASWAGIMKGLDKKSAYNTLEVIIESVGDGGMGPLGTYLRGHLVDYADRTTFAELKEPEQQAEQMKKVLEDLSGRKIHERYELIPITRENVEILREEQAWLELEALEEGEEGAELRYYYDVDGLPYKNLDLEYQLGSHETAEEMFYWGSPAGSSIMAISENPLRVLLDQDGLVAMMYYNMRNIGDVYKERTSIVSPNEALKQVKAHYEREILTERYTISDIELVYTGSFSDGNEGKIRPTVAPFWVVTVYEGKTKGTGRVHFTFDAYTGKCVQEAMNG